jgi:hypothetical protein
MPTVPVDGRPQYPKLTVEILNALAGRPPTAGVVQQVGDRYILDRWPAATRVSGYGGSGRAGPMETPPIEAPKSSAAATALWPNLR